MFSRLSFTPGSHEVRQGNTVDGRNPAPADMVDISIIYRVLYIQGGAGVLPSTVVML